jgi:hypothetical protein
MKNGKYLLSALLFLLTIGFANLALAQDGPRKEDKGASIEGRAGDTNFNLRVQNGEKQPAPQGPEGDSRHARTSGTCRSSWSSRSIRSVRRLRFRYGSDSHGAYRVRRSRCCDSCDCRRLA